VLKTETGSASGPVLFTSCKMVYTMLFTQERTFWLFTGKTYFSTKIPGKFCDVSVILRTLWLAQSRLLHQRHLTQYALSGNIHSAFTHSTFLTGKLPYGMFVYTHSRSDRSNMSRLTRSSIRKVTFYSVSTISSFSLLKKKIRLICLSLQSIRFNPSWWTNSGWL